MRADIFFFPDLPLTKFYLLQRLSENEQFITHHVSNSNRMFAKVTSSSFVSH